LEHGPSVLPAARFISVTEKSLGIPAIRGSPLISNAAQALEMPGF
jgi:hypothetical protein